MNQDLLDLSFLGQNLINLVDKFACIGKNFLYFWKFKKPTNTYKLFYERVQTQMKFEILTRKSFYDHMHNLYKFLSIPQLKKIDQFVMHFNLCFPTQSNWSFKMFWFFEKENWENQSSVQQLINWWEFPPLSSSWDHDLNGW